MPAEIARVALVAVVGVVVVLGVLGVLTLVTMLLVRLFALPDRESVPKAVTDEAAQEREIAAAIAVALSLAQSSPSPTATPARTTAGPKPWVAYGRQALMGRRERMQGLWSSNLRGSR